MRSRDRATMRPRGREVGRSCPRAVAWSGPGVIPSRVCSPGRRAPRQTMCISASSAAAQDRASVQVTADPATRRRPAARTLSVVPAVSRPPVASTSCPSSQGRADHRSHLAASRPATTWGLGTSSGAPGPVNGVETPLRLQQDQRIRGPHLPVDIRARTEDARERPRHPGGGRDPAPEPWAPAEPQPGVGRGGGWGPREPDRLPSPRRPPQRIRYVHP